MCGKLMLIVHVINCRYSSECPIRGKDQQIDIYHLLYLQWNYIGEGGLWCVHHWFVSLVLNSNMCYLTLKASYWFILIIYLINRNLQNKERDQAKDFMNVPWLCLQFGDFLLDLFNLYLQMTVPVDLRVVIIMSSKSIQLFLDKKDFFLIYSDALRFVGHMPFQIRMNNKYQQIFQTIHGKR